MFGEEGRHAEQDAAAGEAVSLRPKGNPRRCPSSCCPSGTVQTVRPSAEMLSDSEPSQALDALASEPEALAAYDKLPVRVRGPSLQLLSHAFLFFVVSSNG